MSFAVVTISGYAGDKAHIIEGEKPWVRLSIATHRREGDGYVTDWHDIVVFNPPTVERAKRVSRGDIVSLVGRLEYRKRVDGDGKTTRIVADRIDFVSPRYDDDLQADEEPIPF